MPFQWWNKDVTCESRFQRLASGAIEFLGRCPQAKSDMVPLALNT